MCKDMVEQAVISQADHTKITCKLNGICHSLRLARRLLLSNFLHTLLWGNGERLCRSVLDNYHTTEHAAPPSESQPLSSTSDNISLNSSALGVSFSFKHFPNVVVVDYYS